MARARKNSIYLDNKQFFIREGSYRREIAPTTIPKFSTGDLSYSDLTAWQYFAQSDWRGGFDNEFLFNGNEYRDSFAVDSVKRYGSIRMSPALLNISGGAASGLLMGTLKSVTRGGTTYPTNNRFSSQPKKIWKNNGSTFKWETAYTAICDVISPFSFFSGENYALTKKPSILSGGSTSVWASATLTCHLESLLSGEYNGKLYAAAASADGGIERHIMSTATPKTGSSWTVEFNLPPGYRHEDWIVYDSKIFILADDFGSSNFNSGLKLFVYDGNVSKEIYHFREVDDLPSLIDGASMAVAYSKLYLLIPVRSTSQVELFFFDGVSLKLVKKFYTEGAITEATNQAGAMFVSEGVLHLGIFNNNPSATTATSFVVLSDNTIHRMYGTADNDLIHPFISGNILYWGINNSTTNSGKYRYLNLESKTYSTSITSYLESSILDMDLFNVDKYFGGLTIYHEPLPSGCTITLKVKVDQASSFTTVGSNSTVNSTSFDIQMLSGNIGKKIEYRIELTTSNSANTPVVQDVVIRYILQPKVKRKWTMDLLIANGIEEYSSKRTALDLDRELWATLRRGAIKFKDVDGVQYDATKAGTDDKGVLISDCKMQGPFPFGDDGPEFVATLELQEG